ncbi:hypothetical protein FIA58_011315 [Flavobacterium jejuense]|uniref:HMA domain-containing protein n=1 Tax=Flavobacterium jejuense TaxID=1544455 RepID=A0ABX0IR38_9FLAO|nr:hypothetical protein [Flavobacterium jejuense]NHN26267.1 hypothetical protein [Flavobacterium jejuense]
MVYVFKTSIQYKKQIKDISKNLNEINEIKKWNFDLEDCDNILRIVAETDITSSVYEIFDALNYSCIELE